MLVIEAPTGTEALAPGREPVQVVGGEGEPAADRLEGSDGQNVAGRTTAGDRVEDRRQGAGDRVLATEGQIAHGDRDRQGAPSEHGGGEGHEALEVGTDDDDVVRTE